MAGFAMVPPAPFEGEVCVAGAWVIPQALSGDGFLFVQTSLPERRVGVLYLRKLHRPVPLWMLA